ncbi:MAG TPA: PilZ domain-containing protein [Bosea sp. (in: a-proteobacteria)]|uniref:PilZ domain-containing protein n=1 Tax=Bosea sp. (in: a-proteobacteria) TaxID=1871050 RepID=UPI002E112595|nr:PilZ domain-containing protein [Bosea sp. (in: a-proteobacteria)]
MSEQRRNARLRALLGARACYNQRRVTVDCVVRNISEGGALLVVSDAVALPASFELEITQRRRSFNAQVRWRSGTRVGVSFETQAADDSAGPAQAADMASRLRIAERDNTRLRNRIDQLTEAG